MNFVVFVVVVVRLFVDDDLRQFAEIAVAVIVVADDGCGNRQGTR